MTDTSMGDVTNPEPVTPKPELVIPDTAPTLRPPEPGEIQNAPETEQARQAGQAQQARQAVTRPAKAKTPSKPAEPVPRETAVEENQYERFAQGPQDNGPELLERTRLNAIKSYYQGTAAGALALKAMATIYDQADPQGISPEDKQARQGARDQYESIVADLIAYELMPSWSGLPQLGAAIGGTVAGSLPSPESFLGWAANGTTWVARTVKAGLQQGLISGASDPAIQALNISAGVQHEYEWQQTLGAFGFGVVLGSGFHGAGEGVSHVVGQREVRRALAGLGQIDQDIIAADHARWMADPRNGIPAPVVSRETPGAAGETPKPEGPPPAERPPLDASFQEAVVAEKERLANSYGAAQPKGGKLNEEAQLSAFNKEVGSDLEAVLGHYGVDRTYAQDSELYKHYDRQPGETPQQALERAIHTWADVEERQALSSAMLDEEFARDLAELDRHFKSEAEKPVVAGVSHDFRGEETRFEGTTYYGPRYERPFQEPPFEPGVPAGEGGPIRAGGNAQPGQVEGAAGGRQGAADVGGRVAERPATGEGPRNARPEGQPQSAREAVSYDVATIAAARDAMPPAVAEEFDFLVAMGADRGNGSSRDLARYNEILKQYAGEGAATATPETGAPKEAAAPESAPEAPPAKPGSWTADDMPTPEELKAILREPVLRKAFKDLDIAMPHRDSPGGMEVAKGWADGRAGLPPTERWVGKHHEPVHETAFNPRNDYLMAYLAARNGETFEIRQSQAHAIRDEILRQDAQPPVEKVTRPANVPKEVPNEVFRGEGRVDMGEAYNQAGAAYPIAGPGLYFSFNEEHAKSFGPNLLKTYLGDVVKKPLVITSDDEWRALTKAAGWEFPNPFGMSAAEMKDLTAALQKTVKAKGHDGLVIWWDRNTQTDMSGGKFIKNLRNVFDEPQAIGFGEPRPELKTEPGERTIGRFGSTDIMEKWLAAELSLGTVPDFSVATMQHFVDEVARLGGDLKKILRGAFEQHYAYLKEGRFARLGNPEEIIQKQMRELLDRMERTVPTQRSPPELEGPKTEHTAQGEQTLIPGVEPVTDRQRIETEMGKPMAGGNKPPPEGGLFDEGARAQGDLLDDVSPLMPGRENNLMREELRRDPQAQIPSAKPGDFTAEQTGALKSLQQQSVALAEALDVPLREGRVTVPKALGIYKIKAGVVRVKELADFQVVSHEMGHAIERKVGKEMTDLFTLHEAEMKLLDYDQDPKTGQRANEGFAEWMRIRMQNPAAAARLAPTFSNAFDALMAQRRPDILKIMADTVDAHNAWLKAPDIDVVAAVVQNTIPDPVGVRGAIAELKEEGIGPTTNAVLQRGYQAFVDKWAPMERAVRELNELKMVADPEGKLVKHLAAYDPATLIRSARRTGQTAHIELMTGIVPFHETAPKGPSFKDVLNEALGKPFLGHWKDPEIERFDQYLASRMSAYLWERYDQGLIPNAPSPIKPGTARQFILEAEAAFPGFKTAADKLQEMMGQVRRKLLDSGIWTPDIYAKTGEYDFYVPMKRIFEEKDVGTGGTADGATLSSHVKRRRGSERDIESPLRNIMMQVFYMEQDIRFNEIGLSLLNLAESATHEGGKYAERLRGMEAKKFIAPLEEMMIAKGKENGIDPGEVRSMIDTLRGDTEGELMGEFWQMQKAAARGEPIIFVWEGGKPVAVRLMSEKAGDRHGLFELMTDTPQPILDVWTNLISIGATVARGGIVNAPTFIVTNYIKDQLQVALSKPGYIPFLGGLKGIWSEMTEGETARMRALYGGVMGGSLVGEVERKFEADIRDMAKQGYWVHRVSSVRGALELMQITEAGTRNSVFESVYQSSLKKGLSPYEAGWEAARVADDIMDFSRHGDRMNLVRRMVPFLNANVQGQDRYTFRTLIEPLYRKQITTRDAEQFQSAIYSWITAGAGGIALGMGWAAINWSKDVYKDASPEVKGTHVIIPIQDGKVLVMPKPFELGIGFTVGEYAYGALMEKDPRAAGEMLDAIRQAFSIPDPVRNTPLVTPGIELMTNHSFFRNRPIVPDSIRNTANPELEYNEKTTSGAKGLGQLLGWSPMKIDYAMGAVFGTVGRDMMSATSLADQDSPTAALDDVMFVRRFIKDGERISGRTRQFWDLMAAKNGKYNEDTEAYRKLVKEATVRGQDPAVATALLNKLPDAERAYVIMREGANSRGQPAFTADERRLHPLVRAHEAVTILNGIARDLQDNTLVPYREKEKLQLDPDQRRKLIDQVRTLAGAEMRNAFAIVGEKGYEGRQVYAPEDFMEVIRKVSPNVAQEIATRYATAKVYTTAGVQEAWPQIKKEVTTYGTDANIKGVAARARGDGFEFAGARAKKPSVVRLPIQGAAVAP